MPPVYKFRVTFEDYDDVSRDIEIRPNQNFREFHKCIQKSINFDDSKPASFYMSTDLWIKGREISTAIKTYRDGKQSILMDDAVLNKFIADPHQKIYYVFDHWTFFIELIRIVTVDDKKAVFPRCIKSRSDAPKQYKPVAPIPGTEPGIDTTDLDREPADEELIEPATEVFEEDHGLEGEESDVTDVADETDEEEEAGDNSFIDEEV